MSRLDGKIAVVTGGNSGIGLAAAKRFAAEGADVVIVGRRQTELDKALETIGPRATAVQGDISRLDDLDRIFATVETAKGRIDVLFANAGLGEIQPIGSITEASFDLIFGVNVKGTLFTVQKALPLMKAGGSIILTGSTTGEIRIQATDLYHRVPFPFVPPLFSILCSDLSSYGVADAVAASMAVPVLFAPVVVRTFL